MYRSTVLLLSLCLAASAFAVTPQFWRVTTAEEALRGEIEGFAVTARGEVRPGPAVEKVVSFTDPFVLSQTAGAGSDRFFGTGNEGKLYRLRGKDLKVLFTAPEPEIYAVAYRNGSVYAATSPNGKIYRVDGESGAQTVFFDPKEAYIWALAFLPSGDLVAATGVEGKLYRIAANGQGKVLYDSPDTHIRSLAVRADGSLLAGAASKGRIYSISADGKGHALFDSPLTEITALHLLPSGEAWAAAVSTTLPSTAPARTQAAAKPGQQTSTASASSEPKKDEASASVDVTFSFEDTTAAASTTTASGASEIYRIGTDGFVETVHRLEREMVFGIGSSPAGDVLLSTGPNGRVYQLSGDELSLIAAVPEKQVVSIAAGEGASVITTTNSGAVYRLSGGRAKAAEIRSDAKDLERFSRFGTYAIEGRNLSNGAVSIAFRSGNTRTPDATWTDWTPVQSTLTGKVSAPGARYLQWKLAMANAAPETVIESVSVAYVNRNLAPTIDAVVVYEPAVVFVSNAYPSSPQVVEATNPDEHGIFTSLDSPRDRTPAEQGKRMFRKGYRTIGWRARDANGDELRYAVSFRKKGTESWLRLREDIEDSQINFDTSQLPDGRYELRIVASDARANAEAPMTDTRDDIEFDVDNTAPRVAVSSHADGVVIRVTDSASPILKAEYAVDAEKWIRLTPTDGIADSPEEAFRLDRKDVDGKFVIVRVVDAAYNVATEAVGTH